MSVEVGLLIALGGFVLSFVVALMTSKRNTQQDSEKEGFQMGVFSQKLTNIDNRLEKIETKLDSYKKDMEIIAQDEIKKHELKYHNGGVK